METYHVGLIATGVFLAWIAYAVVSWRQKRKRQETSLPKPATASIEKDSVSAYYIATVFDADPLKRVLAHGLTYRGKAKVSFSSMGVGISRVGEQAFLIPANEIVKVGTSAGALDKAVERDGITLISWTLGPTTLQTQLRFQSQEDRQKALDSLKRMAVSK